MFKTQSVVSTALATLIFGMSFGSAADAGHRYRYTGTCYNFHGEEHLIAALDHMDNILIAECHRDRVMEVIYAKREVITAYREFCCPRAKSNLVAALRSLNRYMGTGNMNDLDSASRRILAALGNEQNVHVKDVHAAPLNTVPVVPSTVTRATPFNNRPVSPAIPPSYNNLLSGCGPDGCPTRPSTSFRTSAFYSFANRHGWYVPVRIGLSDK